MAQLISLDVIGEPRVWGVSHSASGAIRAVSFRRCEALIIS